MDDSSFFIYGPPGSGKSALGEQLAKDLKLPFFDLDEHIEIQAGMSIPQIFANSGEAGFRQLESERLTALIAELPGVVALGGGALLNPESRQRVEDSGKVLCLEAALETLQQRTQAAGGQRPMLSDAEPGQLVNLLEKRMTHYVSFPLRLKTDGYTLKQSAWQAQALLGAYQVQGMGADYSVRVDNYNLEQVGAAVKKRGLNGPISVVTDENVARIYLDRVKFSFEQAGFQTDAIILKQGEENKTVESVFKILDGLLAGGLDRNSTVIALGGGVVSDLAGFTAAIYLRGIPWVVIPTTLLAMVDASLGGKTGADLPQGKNLVGAFHSPSLVFADPRTLETLPSSEIRNGLAEVVKHGILDDPGLFERCAVGLEALEEHWQEIVSRAMRVKIQVIQEDPYERGQRAMLNLGHTLGHALEKASDYQIKHGEAVSIGMLHAARLAERLGVAQPGLSFQIAEVLSNLGLPTRIPVDIDRDRVLAAMGVDKKRRGKTLHLVLPVRIGEIRWGFEIDDPRMLIDSAFS